ncbi:MFS transporter [Catenuloplanes japonicus]|uniref:MFS transporter n=1 Tax=Catenuloplanes japonicus TaxID=33876 RepID=UPI00052662E9|nr:MFS transporter [Catenuloplanes japonicus]
MTTINPTPTSLPLALAEPTVRVPRTWTTLLFAANLGLWMAFFTPIQVLLPIQIARIDAGAKESMLAWVMAAGALAAIIANPLAGALSDRTCLRIGGRELGRRHAWTSGGAVLAAAGLVLLAHQQTILGVALGWAGVQTCLNAMLASLTAAVPDRVPVVQRAAVSGWVGIPQSLGLVVGAVLTTAVFTGLISGYIAIAIALLLLGLPFALRTTDDPLPRSHRPPLSIRTLLTDMWISPRRHPDFAWAWGTRFLVQLGNALGTLYLLYFLTDGVHHPDPETGLLVLILLYTAGMMATAVVSGRISDRSGRRKAFVIWSGVEMAVAALILAIWPTFPAAIVAAILLGGGYGVYLAVDAALITEVLPAATNRAKDLGVINIANAAPQVLGPLLSAPIVIHLGGYPTLYVLTAVVTLLGSAFVLKIRAVR